MNNPLTFQLGWFALMAAGIVGGYIGYREANVNQKKRIVENVKLTKDRNDSLDALEIKMRKENPKFFKKKINALFAATTSATIDAINNDDNKGVDEKK